MHPSHRGILSGFVQWLVKSDDLDASVRIRTRLYVIACLTFSLVSLINAVGMTWAYQGLSSQHLFALGVGAGSVFLLALLRWQKDPKPLSWVVCLFSISGIWVASYIDHYGRTENFEIGAAYTPYMIASIVFITLIGSRLTSIVFSILCIATLIAFFGIGSYLHYSDGIMDQSKGGLVLRSCSIIMTSTIMIPVSRIIYNSLDELEQMILKAKKAEEIRKELLATMSHEIRTPLNGIISVSDLLSQREHDNTTQTHLNIISLSASNLLDIVNESLGQARSDHLGDMDVRAITVNAEPFNPRELIQQVCDLFTAHAEEQDLWIGTHDLQTLPEKLIGDAPHLRQVMNNLVGNAIKFTKEGGIRLGARPVDETDHGLIIQFFVQDTGVGIEESAQNRIFERFEQSASAQMTELDGTGLGLAICYDLVTAMGGVLTLDSQVGVGSTFYFTLTLPFSQTSYTEFAA